MRRALFLLGLLILSPGALAAAEATRYRAVATAASLPPTVYGGNTYSERLPDGAELHVRELPSGVYTVRPVLSGRLRKTTAVAVEHHAVAAINGGYFNHRDGVGASYVTIDGVVVCDPHHNRLLVGNPELRAYLPKIFDRTEFRILEGPRGRRWLMASHSSPVGPGERIVHALQAGPRLLPELRLEEEGFVAYRQKSGRRRLVRDGIGAFRPAPRSALGLRADGTLLLVAVIGPTGTGLTLPGLRDRLKTLGCREAMALDGGSSTTLVYPTPPAHGQPLYRTIAPPEGEARVRSVLVVLPGGR